MITPLHPATWSPGLSGFRGLGQSPLDIAVADVSQLFSKAPGGSTSVNMPDGSVIGVQYDAAGNPASTWQIAPPGSLPGASGGGFNVTGFIQQYGIYFAVGLLGVALFMGGGRR